MGAWGFNHVDYCVSTPDILKMVDKFASSTMWSVHAPPHLHFHTYNITDESNTRSP